MTQGRQRLCRDAVARGRRIVVTGLGAMYERFVIVAGEEKSAAGRILESREQRVRKLGCPIEIALLERGLHQLNQRRQHERVIVQIGVQVRSPVLVRREELAIAPHRGADEIGGLSRRGKPCRPVEDARSSGERRDHQRIP